ncbi:MAG: serine hydrolase [Alcaligenaceae bacterium]|nr:serine hydrolase [Alcaligenaceae bacterium]
MVFDPLLPSHRLAWLFARLATPLAAAAFAVFAAWPSPVPAQVANFHPCNSQPSLPICLHGYGRRIAVQRWGALPEPIDPDASAKASLVTSDPAAEIKKLKSATVIVEDVDTSEVLFARKADTVRPIASITKLMTALVVVDADLPMDEMIGIVSADRKLGSDLPSRLPKGTSLSRSDLLHLALTASANTAAHALARSYPGGIEAFVQAMNTTAQALGMTDSNFADPTGLSNQNVSTAKDLVKLIEAASERPLIHEFSTDTKHKAAGRTFRNTNMLVGRPHWDILISKTGTTRKAGDCLVMLIQLDGRKLAIVLLDGQGMNAARFGDAVRVRRIVSSEMAVDATQAMR